MTETPRHGPAAVEADLRAMNALASGLSHSLGTPLTSVMNNLVLIRRRLEREAQAPRADAALLHDLARESQEALAGVDRLERVLRAMRDGFRVSPGPFEPLPLHEVVANAVDAFERLDGGAHPLARDLEDVGLVPANRLKVQRVALILLHNAAAMTPAQGAIRVRVRRAQRGAQLVVEDEGPGVPPDLAELVYEPFFTTRPDAVGLGLTMARAFVGVHGGTLRHEPCEPQGARFVATFPSAVTRSSVPTGRVAGADVSSSLPATATTERAAGADVSAPLPATSR